MEEAGSEKPHVGRAGLVGLWPVQGVKGELGLTLGVEGASGELGTGGEILSMVLKGENLKLRKEGPKFPGKGDVGPEQGAPELGWQQTEKEVAKHEAEVESRNYLTGCRRGTGRGAPGGIWPPFGNIPVECQPATICGLVYQASGNVGLVKERLSTDYLWEGGTRLQCGWDPGWRRAQEKAGAWGCAGRAGDHHGRGDWRMGGK